MKRIVSVLLSLILALSPAFCLLEQLACGQENFRLICLVCSLERLRLDPAGQGTGKNRSRKHHCECRKIIRA